MGMLLWYEEQRKLQREAEEAAKSKKEVATENVATPVEAPAPAKKGRAKIKK